METQTAINPPPKLCCEYCRAPLLHAPNVCAPCQELFERLLVSAVAGAGPGPLPPTPVVNYARETAELALRARLSWCPRLTFS
jgi:hypothetical protein